MAISDNNPERRNLTLLSIAIIVFYLAGGYFVGDEIKLIIINVGFHNSDVLGYLVWVMLAWFLFKYWLTSRGAAGELLRRGETFEVKMNYKYIRNYIEKNKTSGAIIKDNVEVMVYAQAHGWVIHGYGCGANLIGVKGRIIIIHYLLITAPLHRISTDFFMPYIFCSFAVILGVINSCK